MASNKELEAEIRKISKVLGIEADVSGNNNQLAARLSELRAKEKAATAATSATPPAPLEGVIEPAVPGTPPAPLEGVTGMAAFVPGAADAELGNTIAPFVPPVNVQEPAKTDTAQVPAVVVDETPVNETPVFIVANGKSVTSLKGVLGEGTEVTEKYFNRPEDFEALKNRKVIVKRGA